MLLAAADLGFPVGLLVLAACLLFPAAIGLLIRRKWRLSVARQREIRRLLVLASEESARAELEAASVGYSPPVSAAGYSSSYSHGYSPIPGTADFESVSVPVPVLAPRSGVYYQCAVCYSPTTTRCARCKSVRYCSGKCQIIHWRQGHKDECCTPTTTDGDESYLVHKLSKRHQNDIFKDRLGKATAFTVESAAADSCSVINVKDNSFTIDSVGNTERPPHSDPESSGTSFSGFSNSSSTGESSDDASISESITSDESVRSDKQKPSDVGLGTLASSLSNLDQVRPSSPKFASLVDSVDSFNKLNDSNEAEPQRDGGKSSQASPSSSEHGVSATHENPVTLPDQISSGFWERTLDNADAFFDNQDDPIVHHGSGAVNSKKSDPQVVVGSKLDSSGSNFSSLLGRRLEIKGRMSDGTSEVALSSGGHGNGFILPENNLVDGLKARSSSSTSSRSSNAVDSGSGHDTKGLHGGFTCVSSSSLFVHSSSSSGRDMSDRDSSEVQRSNVVDTLKVKSNQPERSTRASYFDSCPGTDSEFPETNGVKSAEPSSSHVQSSSGNKSDSDDSELYKFPPPRSEKSNLRKTDHAFTTHLAKSSSLFSASQTCMASGFNDYSVPSVKVGKVDNVEAGDMTSTKMASYNARPVSGLKLSVKKVVDQFRTPRSGRSIEKGLFAYDLFVRLYISNKVETQPFGLLNCGNSCYANAVLQCLAFTPPLTAYFVQGLHSKACVNEEWCFSCEFEKLMVKAKECKSPLSPSGILFHLQRIGSQLGNGREEDAHEFLRYAIDAMQSVCLKEAGISAPRPFEEETTLISLTFGGHLRSRIKCAKCQYKSERQERIMDLTVEIEGDIGKLEDALKRFTSTEVLDGENKYQCSRCKSYERAKKKLKIFEAPNILTIMLKRFQSGKFGKLNKLIRYPEILDLAPYMSGTSDKTPIYRLYGVVVHLDIMNAAFSGHYVCYVRNIHNKWFKVDDSTVTVAEVESVLSKKAYMLLYARCSPRAPGILRNIIVPTDPKVKASSSSLNRKDSTAPNLGSKSTQSGVFQVNSNAISADNPPNVESFYLRFHRLQKILGEDSSSDSLSFTSSNSDEGSCSTESNRDSTSTEDMTDYIFGNLNNSPWRSTLDSDTSSSSSSPLYSRHSPLASRDRNSSGYHETSNTVPITEDDNGRNPFLQSKSTKSRKLASSGSCRETDSTKLGSANNSNDVKSRVSIRKSASERTDKVL